MEVPYLDVLRTTTNLSLPLTYLETDEFGLPALRLSDFAGQLQWSPMETLGEKGTPGIFQIVRTGLNDSEVFAYESAKWIVRSRGQNKTQNRVYLAIEGNQGHFVHGKTGLHQQAEDISSIFTLIKNQRNEYRMPASRNNRKTERKNRKDRKERKNRKETRKNRKNRKGTRKNRK
jgi:protease II